MAIVSASQSLSGADLKPLGYVTGGSTLRISVRAIHAPINDEDLPGHHDARRQVAIGSSKFCACCMIQDLMRAQWGDTF